MGNKLCGGDTTTSTSTADKNSLSRKSTETDTEIFGELIGTIRDQKWEDKYKVVKKNEVVDDVDAAGPPAFDGKLQW